MEAKDKKRSRGEANDQSNKSPPPPPSYGSQEYWEGRYRKLQKVQADQEPEPFHAWYFSYEDLAPLLLPLVLGEDEEEVGEKGETKEESEDENASKEGEEEDKKTEDDQQDEEKSEKGGGDDNESAEEGEEEGDEEIDDEASDAGEEEVTPRRIGLVKNGPISIIEIGCGDVPLGRDLALGVKQLEPETGIKTERILKKVVCTDYSETVIKAMKEEQRQNKGTDDKDTSNTLPLVYEVADARKLPYADNSFEMVIEKGTLDAMLSDKELGSTNCRSIVAECARILSIGGEIGFSRAWCACGFRYYLIISCSHRFNGNCVAFECSH
jgi:hypothetical protein